MRTRAKQKHVASDRAWRENVPRHIFLFKKKTVPFASLIQKPAILYLNPVFILLTIFFLSALKLLHNLFPDLYKTFFRNRNSNLILHQHLT